MKLELQRMEVREEDARDRYNWKEEGEVAERKDVYSSNEEQSYV